MFRFCKSTVGLILIAVISVSTFLTGCEEQPAAYVFSPTQRDETNFARTIAEIVDLFYQHADDAAQFLDQAALTDDYGSLLLGGWNPHVLNDSLTGDPYTVFGRNYLDQKYYSLRFDRDPDAGAVRTPSNLDYTYLDLLSYQNRQTSEFNPDINQSLVFTMEYSDNRQDPKNLDGWFDVRKIIPVEQELETAGAGTQTYFINILVRWQIKVENFSIDKDDHRARLVFSGVYPIYDSAGETHQTLVEGGITLDANGVGVGDFSFYGERVVRLNLTGKTYGFNGYFTLFGENHRQKYQLD